MTRRNQLALLAAVAVAGLVAWWMLGGSSEEREIRRRLDAFVADFNAGTTDGLATVARAARIGDFFTSGVTVELGQGTAPIQGRETLIGMAARLQTRTAAFVLELDDVTVDVLAPGKAEATFTAVIRRSAEESIDAREFAAEFVEEDGRWRVSRLVAVDTLR